jgi:3-phosphoshikimate 1-carboxyvinyltransferase
VAFVDCLSEMGCRVEQTETGLCVTAGELVGIDVDMNAISDTAQTLAVVAAFASSPTRIRGIAHARLKETDRVNAMVTELRRLGLTIDEHHDGLTVHPGPLSEAEIQTYDDHRMAMSFTVAGLASPGITIADPDCTAKTYPGFFDDMDRLCGDPR